MSHYPTSFFILDNEELGTCWIGQTKMRLDTNGRSLLPHISREQLVDKLATKYEEYSYPCLEVERVKKDGTYLFYGLEQWLTKLNCEIKRNPRKLRDVNELLTAGWIEGDPTINSTVYMSYTSTTQKKLYKMCIESCWGNGKPKVSDVSTNSDVKRMKTRNKIPSLCTIACAQRSLTSDEKYWKDAKAVNY